MGREFIKTLMTPGWGGYFFEDLSAIRESTLKTSEKYFTKTDHNRFPWVRSSSEAVAIGLVLGVDGAAKIAWGHAVPVSFSGKSGRVVPMSKDAIETFLKTSFEPWLRQLQPKDWLFNDMKLAKDFSDVPPYILYGLSQALLRAASIETEKPLWKILKESLGNGPLSTVAVHGSSGSDLNDCIDRMLAKKIPFLPQGQFESLEQQIGLSGGALKDWILWFKTRASKFEYIPTLTLDFHGALDQLFGNDLDKIAEYIHSLGDVAAPHPLHVESPLDCKTFDECRSRHSELIQKLKSLHHTGTRPKIIIDEWANDLPQIQRLISDEACDGFHIKMPDMGTLSDSAKAIAYCRNAGLFCILGGSCTETAFSAEVSTLLAMVTKPSSMLIKPGMGFDESFSHQSFVVEMAIAEERMIGQV